MLLSNTKEGAINSDRGGQGGQDDIKARLENKDFTRQKREHKDSGGRRNSMSRGQEKCKGKQRKDSWPLTDQVRREWARETCLQLVYSIHQWAHLRCSVL